MPKDATITVKLPLFSEDGSLISHEDHQLSVSFFPYWSVANIPIGREEEKSS